ncbi:MAG TPA: Spy/CpxP family protein refolding chaperone [Stellaceae bacterium]|nr:Spy/CpxP family protein refolding chaperone [Stellaceae bacterium]
MLRRSLAALALAASLAGGTALTLAVAPADAQSQQPQQQQKAPRHNFSMSRHIEGRIAYVKAELKVTDAQAPLWNKVADTMRSNAKAMDDIFASMRRDPNAPAPSAVDRLEMRSRLAAARAQGDQQLLAAFKPLYDNLSPDQKKAADDLFGSHGRHGHRHG